MVVVALIAFYFIISLFVKEKNWGEYSLAVAGFTSLPVLSALFVRSLNIQPTSKVVIITGIWATWVVLAAIVAFATYYYWYNNPTIYRDCVGGLCNGANILQ